MRVIALEREEKSSRDAVGGGGGEGRRRIEVFYSGLWEGSQKPIISLHEGIRQASLSFLTPLYFLARSETDMSK